MMIVPPTRTAWCAVLLAPAAALLLSPTPARAQSLYTFTDVADTHAGGTFTDLGLAPNLNAAGLVAFTGQLAAGGSSGVFTNSGPAGGITTTTVVTNTPGGPLVGFSFDTPRVNAAGTVVFRAASADTGASGIFGRTGANGALTTRVDNSGIYADVFSPSLNNAGQVAFTAVSAANSQPGVFRLNPSVTVGSAPANFTTLGARTTVNAAGTVTLVADRGGAGTGTDVLVGNGSGAPVSVVGVGATTGLASIDLGVAPQVSGDGRTVTFLATRTNGSRGIFQFTLDGSVLTTLVETGNGQFSDVSDFSLAGDQFAFLGTITPTALDPDGTRGLFNGADPLLNRIVTEGSLLTVNGTPTAVASLAFTDGGLTASGQVAFYAGFSDVNNTAAIFRADVVPEPGSLALLLLAGGGLATCLVRRHRRHHRSPLLQP